MKQLDLHQIAETLEGLEETIIFKLLDRAQFHHNPKVYCEGQSGFASQNRRSLFDVRLLYQERMDAQFGRFSVPEERPFNHRLPASKREVAQAETGLHLQDFNCINQCADIRSAYLELVPFICKHDDDGQYGSSTEHDVYAIQAIARRIHYGALYVAESKFRSEIEAYRPLIRDRDSQEMLKRLTRQSVEDAIIERVRAKVDKAQEQTNRTLRHWVDPGAIMLFYRDTIIPLTKKGEIAYLLHRTLQA